MASQEEIKSLIQAGLSQNPKFGLTDYTQAYTQKFGSTPMGGDVDAFAIFKPVVLSEMNQPSTQQPITTPTITTTPSTTPTNTESFSNTINTGVVTSQPVSTYLDQLREDYSGFEEDVEKRKGELEQQRVQRLSEIENIFGEEERKLKEQQKQEVATQGVLGFRLGQEGTPYAADAMRQLVNEHQFESSKLQSQKQESINKINSAIADENFKLASQLREDYRTLLKEEENVRVRQAEEYAQAAQQAMDTKKFNLEQQKLSQEILKNNLDLYSSSMISYDDEGNLILPSQEELNQYAEELGISPNILVGSVRNKYQEMSKLSQEDQKRELDILNSQRQLVPQLFQEYNYAQQELGYNGTWQEYLNEKQQADTTMPSSYKEWQYAGGEQGTGKTYADWLKKTVGDGLTTQQIATFNSIVNKYQASPLVKAADRTLVLKTVSDELENDPTNAALQVSFIYSMIQALDTYQSAVREGEIGLIGSTQGVLDKIQNLPAKIEKGSVLSTKKVDEYIKVAETLTDSITKAAEKKETEFSSQANVSGIAGAWTEYINGFKMPTSKYSNVIDFGTRANQDELNQFNSLKNAFPDKTPQELFEFYMEEQGFNQPLSMGVKGSLGIKDGSKVKTSIGTGIATGIERGSNAWSPGLDLVLEGGKGAEVKSPLSGEVVKVRDNFYGFGKQVAIRLSDGSEIWLSHLDDTNVEVGQKVSKGTTIGKQGNTGNLLSMSGQKLTKEQIASGRGTHVDITWKKSGKKDSLNPNDYYTSQEVAAFLNTNLA